MVFGTNFEKVIGKKIMKFNEMIDEEIDEKVEKLIDKQYFYCMHLSATYSKMDKRNRVLSLFLSIFSLCVITYHFVLLVRSTQLTLEVNMVLFSQSAHFTLLNLLAINVSIHFKTKRKYIYLFHKMLSIEFFDYEEPPNPGEDEIRKAMVRERGLLRLIPLGVVPVVGAVLVLSPIVDKTAGTIDQEMLSREFSTHLPYPYGKYPFQTKEGFGYFFAIGGQILFSLVLMLVIGTAGLLYLNLTQNVSLHLQLLQNSMYHLESRAKNMYFRLFGEKKGETSLYGNLQFSYCYNVCLRKNFQHHQVILRAFKYTEEIMSMPVLQGYMIGTLVIALGLISASSVKELPGTTVASSILCLFEVGFMFMLSIFGQRIGDLNLDLRFELYSIKWYLCNKKLKTNLLIFQEKTMKPLTMMAGGIVPANMETFATVMNSAYSFYNLINAFE